MVVAQGSQIRVHMHRVHANMKVRNGRLRYRCVRPPVSAVHEDEPEKNSLAVRPQGFLPPEAIQNISSTVTNCARESLSPRGVSR